VSHRRRRLFTPLAVAFIVLAAVGLVIWGLSSGSSMFSAGPLNAQTKTQPPGGQTSGGQASSGQTSGGQPSAGQSSGGQTAILGGVSSHAALADNCSACHAVPFSSATMAGKCLACHTDVQQEISAQTGLHGKMITAGWAGTTCGGCHTEHHGAAGKLTVLDKSFPHNVTGFSLRAHSGETSCQDCHGSDFKTFDPRTCESCHQRMDAGFMAQHTAAFGDQCVPCHDGVDRYGENFDHNKLAFPLTGGHADVSCASCHKDATSVEALKSTPTDCYSCHAKDDAHAGKFGTDCAGCHSTASWKDATFDHSKTSFPLTGAHASLSCEKCHVGGNFSAASAECVSCHAEPGFHAGAFGSQSTQCASCHTSTAWTPATFDLAHTFPLDHGSEEQVPTCKTCHPTTVTQYTCFGCHEHTPDNVVAEHEGATLQQLQDCARCHQGGRGGD
jgi:hypothetical protein